MTGATLRSVIEVVFSMQRIEGLPDWARKQTYDVIAEIDPEDCCRWSSETPQEEALTVQEFLQEKLKLKWHTETRMVGGFDLRVGKKGPKFAQAQPNSAVPGESMKFFIEHGDLRQLNAPISMDELAAFLSGPAGTGHPVVDKTGLAGRYVLSGKYRCCEYPYDNENVIEADGNPVQPSGGPTVFDDLNVLGLELKAAKVPMDFLVIDQIERPEN